jgi:hypothetical protein
MSESDAERVKLMAGWKIGISYTVVSHLWIYHNRSIMINEDIFGKACDNV